ncbi:hypothetical protein E4T56_gene11393 [Termitomyces sp. T112]|nr:hypothetical protein E4T56_gene11393 [Termitomyces sp. T112]
MVLSDSGCGGAAIEELELEGFVEVVASEVELTANEGAGGATVNEGREYLGSSAWRKTGCGVGGDRGSNAVDCSGLPVGVTGGVSRSPGHCVFAAIFPVMLVDLDNERLVPVIGGLLGCEVKDILDPLKQDAMEGKLESVVVPAALVGFLFESYNKGREVFVVTHSEVEEIFLCLRYGVKDAKLT